MRDDQTPWTAPAEHVDFVLDDTGEVVSTGLGAAEWLEQAQALPRLWALLRRSRGDKVRRGAWWLAAHPVYFRFVPLEHTEGTHHHVTVVPTRPELAKALELLSPTQREVAEYAAAGATAPEIAEAMDRSPETIRTHIKDIYRLLSICTRLELQWLMRRPAISFDSKG